MDPTRLLFLLCHFPFTASLNLFLWQNSNPTAVVPALKNSSCLVPLAFQQFENSSLVCVRFDGSKKLKDAISECQKIFAYPACITTEIMLKAVGDLSFVQQYSSFMVGATLDNQTGQWTCSNGREIPSSDAISWNPGEPSRGITEKCLQTVFQGTNYGVNDTSCSSEAPYMCEFSVTCDRAKPREFYQVGNYSYCFNNVLTTYAEASAICDKIGAKMACPRDSNTTAFFQRVAVARAMPNVYVGLTDLATDGIFTCWDGSIPAISGNWLSGEPNGNTYENCASLAKSSSYKLADYTCERPHYSICEIPYSGKAPI